MASIIKLLAFTLFLGMVFPGLGEIGTIPILPGPFFCMNFFCKGKAGYIYTPQISPTKGKCSLNDISITQTKTGGWAHGMPEVSVIITNNCVCPQSQLKLNCAGFQTNESVDPSILSVSGNVCILKNGRPIAHHETVTFRYAWDPQFPFQPVSSKSKC